MSGKQHTPEFIDAVRKLAARRLSAQDAALEMSVNGRHYSRNAMIGVGHRNGFTFSGPKNRGGRVPGRSYPQQQRKTAWKSSMTISNGPTPHVVVVRKLVTVPQRVLCSWHGCDRPTEAGDMFCAGHNRKGLM